MLPLRKEAVNPQPWPDPGFGIYVHWPFCLAKCPYCDFNSHVRESVDHARWQKALVRELEHYAAQTAGRVVTSIFFGGGTPSLMSPKTVAAVIDAVAVNWELLPGAEITLEANPTSVEADKFRDFRAAGVNRVSLGVQALDDTALQFLGRKHSMSEALHAVELAAFFFPRFTFDLIYARPGQTQKDWQAELRQALSFTASHLSLYQLTIEPGTAFHTFYQRGEFQMPDDETKGVLYETTQEMLEQAGMSAYEISNHARPGDESRHNLTYWRYGDYAGVGPGAHGRLTLNAEKFATRAHRAPEVWLEQVEKQGHGSHAPEIVDMRARGQELVMMGLRLTEGISLVRLEDETGMNADQILNSRQLATLMAGDFIEQSDGILKATKDGRQKLDKLLELLLA